ncbi:MAG: glycosyl hydrolase [Mariniblastus sp.]
MKTNLISSVALVSTSLIFLASSLLAQDEATKRKLAKFEPAGDKCIVFVGQSLPAIGGLKEFNDGNMDHFAAPGGFTMYTNLRPGDESFGHQYRGIDGVTKTDDWGDGPNNMSLQIADPDFEHMALAIGLELVNHEKALAKGERDEQIKVLGEWIKGLGKRPVFLRIGYEFDGHSWNHYDRESYIASFKRIRDKFTEMEITNVAYVWQSCGFMSTQKQLEQWYPGDEYVDWVGYSFFNNWKKEQMTEFGRKKGKPVFIAEATPAISVPGKNDGSTFPLSLADEAQAQRAWDEWFTPFIKSVNDNKDVVKAISYIPHDWYARAMWKDNPTFKGIDSRLNLSPMLEKKWKEEFGKERYLNASPELFQLLYENE